MGCSSPTQMVQHPMQIHKPYSIQAEPHKPYPIQAEQNKPNQEMKTSPQSSPQKNGEEFQQQKRAIQILCKQELSSEDFQYLLRNLIWKEEWFIFAAQMLKINPIQHSKHQSSIMQLFLLVKIKEAKFIQNQSHLSVLCEQCYNKQVQKIHIDSRQIDSALFQTCKQCSGNGWVKANHIDSQQQIPSQCCLCSKIISSYKIQTQCPDCNTLGFKWIV